MDTTDRPIHYYAQMDRPKAVTLFSGVGSSSLALRNLGYRVIAHDLMPEAVETLRANGFLAFRTDVRDIDYTNPPYQNVEILVGGPPCQPFSQAHSGDGEYDERDMIPEFIRAVREMKPAVFVMEEVKTLTWKKHRRYFEKVLLDLNAEGYFVDYKVLDSSKFGVGQARKRLFVVGVRNDIAEARSTSRNIGRPGGPEVWTVPFDAVLWPEEETGIITMAEALGWTMDDAVRANLACPAPAYAVHLSDLNWVFERPAPTVVGSFRPDVAAKPGWRKPGDGPRQNTRGSVSTTLEERLILQGLPKDWVVCGSEAKRDLQVGNSCPTPLLEAIIDINIP